MLAQIALFDGFDPLDAIGSYEVLYAAGMFTDGDVRVELVTAEGPREVPSGTPPVTLTATGALDPARADLLVLPGAAGVPGEVPGRPDLVPVEVRLARALETGLPRLAGEAMARDDTLVATVCGGSLLLAMAGLAKGRPATGHGLTPDVLRENGAVPVDARVVDDGDLVTGAGVTSGIDLALHLVDREIGPRVAHAVETLFHHERRGTVWSPGGRTPTLTL
ncbi:DJ-1/PfpI family protein [Streptomyces sp. NPDC048172]|uniref:DJ-1/PfpI family protein n=1 Tax=Streptomyces sp. NPDC048172 TaxID=3365505 RepID=UPI0037211215